MMDVLTLGASLKAMLQEADDLAQEIATALEYDDYGLVGHCHARHQAVLEQIRTMEKDISHAVVSWVETAK